MVKSSQVVPLFVEISTKPPSVFDCVLNEWLKLNDEVPFPNAIAFVVSEKRDALEKLEKFKKDFKQSKAYKAYLKNHPNHTQEVQEILMRAECSDFFDK